jgi:hypothetical protein
MFSDFSEKNLQKEFKKYTLVFKKSSMMIMCILCVLRTLNKRHQTLLSLMQYVALSDYISV